MAGCMSCIPTVPIAVSAYGNKFRSINTLRCSHCSQCSYYIMMESASYVIRVGVRMISASARKLRFHWAYTQVPFYAKSVSV
jgi:hypothetical protein